MKDQNRLDTVQTPAQEYDSSLSLFTVSVLKPDSDFRGFAYKQD